MTGSAPDILLDVTRTVSRIGAGGDSGVDRVERAYIRELLSGARGKAFFLTRVFRGAALLDTDGMTRMLGFADAPATLPAPDLLSRAALKQSNSRRRAETAVRQAAIGWVGRASLPGLLREHLKNGFTALNVGHTHLDEDVLAALRSGGAARLGAMIHDVIPLDFPEYSRPEAPARFEKLLRGVAGAADLLIYNSQDTASRTARWLEEWGLARPGVAALLGSDPIDQIDQPPAEKPHFVILGTIEPRKNHLLLLSLWRQMAEQRGIENTPDLYIIGRRGWENENVLDFLERSPLMGRVIHETGYIPDEEMTRLLGQARALLFPSFAEGFGYPLVEAQQMGIPVICSDLPVYREIANGTEVFLDPLDGPGWRRALLEKSHAVKTTTPNRPSVPDWETHFELVFAAL